MRKQKQSYSNCTPTPRIRTINDLAKAEFYQIQKYIAINQTLGSSWVVMWKKPSYQKRAFLAVAITGIIQCSGVLVINNYGPSLVLIWFVESPGVW